MRALASYWFGIRRAIVTAKMAATHDTASASHRYFHIPLRTSAIWPTASLIALEAVVLEAGLASAMEYSTGVRAKGLRSEEALRNDQDVSRPHLDVGGNVTPPDQILQPHRILRSACAPTQDR